MHRVFISGVLAGGLAGCGRSSDQPDGLQLFEDKLDAAVTLEDAFRTNNGPLTSPADLPPTGGAAYQGAIGVFVDDAANTRVIGDLTITTNFDPTQDLITGNAGNFVSNAGDQFTGQLGLSNGALGDPLGYGTGFTADMDGTLTGADTGRITVDGTLSGGFGEAIANPGPVSGVLGRVDARVTTDAGTFDADGRFVAD